jgi:hypothetical protein
VKHFKRPLTFSKKRKRKRKNALLKKMDSLSVASVKQAARQAMHVASDKLKLAEAVVGSSEYQVKEGRRERRDRRRNEWKRRSETSSHGA